MFTTVIPKLLNLADRTPHDTCRTFRQAYTLEQVMELLWHSQHPHLVATFTELDPLHTDKLTAFYENLEILFSAVYQLPDLPSLPQAPEPTMTLCPAGDQRHVC